MTEFIYADTINIEDEIELEEGSQEITPAPSGLEFPCVLVKGTIFTREIEFIRDLKRVEETVLPLYVEFEGENEKVGQFSLDVDNVLKVKSLGCSLTLYLPDGSTKDLFDPDVLLNFIRL
jgi:hypothetical protein